MSYFLGVVLLAAMTGFWWIRRELGASRDTEVSLATANALAAGLSIGLAVAIALVVRIMTADSSTAPIALYGVPVIAGAAALIAACFGWSISYLWSAAGRNARRILMVALLVAALGLAFWIREASAPGGLARDPNASPAELTAVLERALDERRPWLLLDLVENPATEPEALVILAQRDEPWLREVPKGWRLWLRSEATSVQVALAARADSTHQVLSALADSQSGTVRQTVAANPMTSPSILQKLAGDPDDVVLRSVARNPATPEAVLESLAWHEDSWVRFGVARNPSAPPEILDHLTQDPVAVVREAVATNPSSRPPSIRSNGEATP